MHDQLITASDRSKAQALTYDSCDRKIVKVSNAFERILSVTTKTSLLNAKLFSTGLSSQPSRKAFGRSKKAFLAKSPA